MINALSMQVACELYWPIELSWTSLLLEPHGTEAASLRFQASQQEPISMFVWMSIKGCTEKKTGVRLSISLLLEVLFSVTETALGF